jgi:hypothetical protein
LAVTKVEVLSAAAFGVSFTGSEENEVPRKPERVKAANDKKRLILLISDNNK